jgi:predicted nucleotide-binding protein
MTSNQLHKISGFWIGKLEGTNSGGVAIDLAQDQNRVEGTGKFFEPALGTYSYHVSGAIENDKITFFLQPLPNQYIALGQVQAQGTVNDKGAIVGKWQSTIGTAGTFFLNREENVDADPPPKNSVFIVHGHDSSAKHEAARLVEALGLKATILSERANGGQTLIEKFEKHAGDAGFAIALFTPDDLGHPFSKPEMIATRARQNVVLELGYFIGKLSRHKVAILYKQGVELPSDVLGVAYVEMDERGAWRLQVANELRNAGYDVDLNRL